MQWFLLGTMWMKICFSSLWNLHWIGRKELIFTCVRINWWCYLWSEKYYYCRIHLWNRLKLRILSFPPQREHCICQTNATLCVYKVWFIFESITVLGISSLIGSFRSLCSPYLDPRWRWTHFSVALTQLCQWQINFHSHLMWTLNIGTLADRSAVMSVIKKKHNFSTENWIHILNPFHQTLENSVTLQELLTPTAYHETQSPKCFS